MFRVFFQCINIHKLHIYFQTRLQVILEVVTNFSTDGCTAENPMPYCEASRKSSWMGTKHLQIAGLWHWVLISTQISLRYTKKNALSVSCICIGYIDPHSSIYGALTPLHQFCLSESRLWSWVYPMVLKIIQIGIGFWIFNKSLCFKTIG